MWADLVEWGFGLFVEDMTLCEMHQLWMDRLNAKGFQYEVSQDGKTIYRTSPIFIYPQ